MLDCAHYPYIILIILILSSLSLYYPHYPYIMQIVNIHKRADQITILLFYIFFKDLSIRGREVCFQSLYCGTGDQG